MNNTDDFDIVVKPPFKSKKLRLSGVVESSNCVHYGLIDLGYSDLFWCQDCQNKVIRIEDKKRASGYRMELKK